MHLRILSLLTVSLVWAHTSHAQESVETVPVFFKTNSSVIDPRYYPKLDVIGSIYAGDESAFLKIFGFADPAGRATYNDSLSERRAQAVFDYLNKRFDIDSSRLFVTWLGEEADAYDLHFPNAHIQQRCVDVVVYFRNPLVR